MTETDRSAAIEHSIGSAPAESNQILTAIQSDANDNVTAPILDFTGKTAHTPALSGHADRGGIRGLLQTERGVSQMGLVLTTAGIEAAITQAVPIKPKFIAFSAQAKWLWGTVRTLGTCTRMVNRMNIAVSDTAPRRA